MIVVSPLSLLSQFGLRDPTLQSYRHHLFTISHHFLTHHPLHPLTASVCQLVSLTSLLVAFILSPALAEKGKEFNGLVVMVLVGIVHDIFTQFTVNT